MKNKNTIPFAGVPITIKNQTVFADNIRTEFDELGVFRMTVDICGEVSGLEHVQKLFPLAAPMPRVLEAFAENRGMKARCMKLMRVVAPKISRELFRFEAVYTREPK